MNLSSSKTKSPKHLAPLAGAVCIICLFATSCQPELESPAGKDRVKYPVQPADSFVTNKPPVEPTQPTDKINNNFADTVKAEFTSVSAESELGAETRRPAGVEPPVTAAVEKTASVPAKTQFQFPVEILAGSDTQLPVEEELPGQPDINLPAFTDPDVAGQLISVNFDQVDIRVMLKTIGDITGINFVLDDSVHGKVTMMSPTKIRLGDVYKVLESVLQVKGYAAVPTGNLVKIVPRAEAADGHLQVRVGSNPSKIPKSDSLITQIIPLKYADAAEVSRIIKPLVAKSAHMAVYSRTNSILITDTSSNIRHIAEIIQKLDVSGSKQHITVITLEYASAEMLSEQITRIMEKSKDSPRSGPSRNVPQIETGIKILPDIRTNSLIVVANAEDTETINKLATQLDIQRPVGTNNVHVVYLKNAPAKETAESLTQALANLRITGALEATQQVQVTADVGTNALIIAASPQDYSVISEIIEKLDIVREQVLVEMLIMEVSEDSLKEIGIDWATLDKAVTGGARFFGQTNFGPRVDFASGDLEGLTIGAWKMNGTDVSIGPILTALEKKSGVNILSTPHIVTSNHNKARILVGENRPFVTQSRITETDPSTPTVIKTFEYKDVGILLEITPHISQGGLVRLEINSEFTKLIATVTTPSIETPTTAKRQAQTIVSMHTGSTVVIGGLIRDDKVTIKKKIPLVSEIPLLGELFKFQKDQVQKTNLLIFITPYVMGSSRDFEKITEQKKKQMIPAQEKFEQENAQR